MQLIYDGSYTGFLTAVFECYEYKLSTVIITSLQNTQSITIQDSKEVISDKMKAERVLNGLKKKVSYNSLDNLYKCYLSELTNIENTMLEFIRYVFSSTKNIEKNYGDNNVLIIEKIAKKVNREKHRFEAFVRFENIGNNLFYAPIEPDFNILPLILKHFKTRYASQNWVIYDLKRKYGIMYDNVTEKLNEVEFNFSVVNYNNVIEENILIDKNEQMYKTLWQNYFKNTNIPIRKNTKLHLQHLPKRYWKYLTEKQ